MYRIDEFSHIFKIPVSQLKGLENELVFKWTHEDKISGYQYYDDAQLDYFSDLKVLKIIGWDNKKLVRDKKIITKEFVYEAVKKYREQNKDTESFNRKKKEIEEYLDIDYSEPMYGVGVLDNPYIGIIGKVFNLNSREEYEEKLMEIRKIFKDNNMRYRRGVFISNSVGYSKKFPDAFIGYEVPLLDFKKYKKEHLNAIGLTKRLGSRGKTTLFTICNNDVPSIYRGYSDILIFAKKNNYQTLGGFYEVYDGGKCEIFLEAYPLDEEKTSLARCRKMFPNQFEVKDKETLVGKWKLVEILPGVTFNPNYIKNIYTNKYKELELKEDGTSNYPNLKWKKKCLITDDVKGGLYHRLYAMEIDGKLYIEVFLQDEYTLTSNAKPLSNIYVKIS